jgi:hypothetical protein
VRVARREAQQEKWRALGVPKGVRVREDAGEDSLESLVEVPADEIEVGDLAPRRRAIGEQGELLLGEEDVWRFTG